MRTATPGAARESFLFLLSAVLQTIRMTFLYRLFLVPGIQLPSFNL